MADPVLTVLAQIELELETLVVPQPAQQPNPFPPTDANALSTWQGNTAAYQHGNPLPTDLKPAFADVKVLLAALYKIDFVKTTGNGTIAPLVGELVTLITKIADELQNVSAAAGGLPGLKSFLDAIEKLPGSPPALKDATDALNQIIALLGDVPSGQNLLYMIAQQLSAFQAIFLNPA
jgi:hypothetical protein